MRRMSNALLLIWVCCTLPVIPFELPDIIENITEDIYDLCIIGAGIFGSAAARHASAYKYLRICIIGLDEPSEKKEYEERDTFASHYDSGRIVTHMFKSPAFQKLTEASIRQFRALSVLSDFYDPVTFLRIGNKHNNTMKILEDVSAAVNTPLRTINDQRSMDKKYPFIKLPNCQYALHDYAGTGVINPRKMIKAELKAAELQGCRIIIDKVENVRPLKDNYHSIETTNHGIIKSRRVLFTTGSFTNVHAFDVLPQFDVDVYKETTALLRITDNEAHRLRNMPTMEYETNVLSRYILPPVIYPDGNAYVKVGRNGLFGNKLQTKEEIKEVYLSNETNEEAISIAEAIFDIIPDLKVIDISPKLCITCSTPTGYPYVDRWTPTVTVAAFGNGWGATISEEIGRLAAHLSLFGIWDSDIPKSLFEIVTKTGCRNSTFCN